MSTNPFDAPQIDTTTAKPAADPNVLPTSAHVMAGWPLILIIIGGAIGGLLGGLAYAINLAIYKSQLPAPVKVVLNLGVGVAAFALWLAAAIAINVALNR